jgi:hypothetical protein
MAKNDRRGAGAKYDAGKPYIHSVLRYFPRAIEEIARVNEHGASNHGWDTWDSIEDAKGRYDDARLRHDLADAAGKVTDEESGLLHAAHRAWGNLAVLELMLREREHAERTDLDRGTSTIRKNHMGETAGDPDCQS